MTFDDEIKFKRAKLTEHLEAALVLSDDTKDGVVGFYVESALDQLRADTWPGNLDLPSVGKRWGKFLWVFAFVGRSDCFPASA